MADSLIAVVNSSDVFGRILGAIIIHRTPEKKDFNPHKRQAHGLASRLGGTVLSKAVPISPSLSGFLEWLASKNVL